MHGHALSPNEKSYEVGYQAYGIDFNGTYYFVQHRNDNKVTVLDAQGGHVRKFEVREVNGERVEFGWDIHSDRDTHQAFIPCEGGNDGILHVSIYGELLRFTELDGVPRGITDLHGFLCVVDNTNDCVNLFSKDGQFVSELISKDHFDGYPDLISINESNDKIIISFHGSDIITIFKLN